MAAQDQGCEAESEGFKESSMMQASCGQACGGTLPMDKLQSVCQDSSPMSPSSEPYDSDTGDTVPQPLLAVKNNVAVASTPWQSADNSVVIASSVSTSATQAQGGPAQRVDYDYEYKYDANKRKEHGSMMDGRTDDQKQAAVMLRDPATGAAGEPFGLQNNAGGHRHRVSWYQDATIARGQEAVGRRRNLRDHGPGMPVKHGHTMDRSYDGAGVVVDLHRARELQEAYLWSISCLACHEKMPDMWIKPCGHHYLCQRCFFEPFSYPYFHGGSDFLCPLCRKPGEELKFSQDMLEFLMRRSMTK